MKTLPLIRTLRVLFGVLRILAGIALACLLPMLLPWVPLTVPATSYFRFEAKQDVRVEMKHITGSTYVHSSKTAAPELQSARPWVVLIGASWTLYVFALADSVWRLLRNAEAGRIFTTDNVRLLRRLGYVLLTGTVLVAAGSAWIDYQVGGYLTSHQVIANGSVSLTTSLYELLYNTVLGSTDGLIYGAAILILAEVFAQGLALKQESELTV